MYACLSVIYMFNNKELAGFTENCWWHLLITFFRRPLLYSAPLDVLAMPKEEKKWEKLYAWMSDLVNSCLPLFFQCFFIYICIDPSHFTWDKDSESNAKLWPVIQHYFWGKSLLYPPVLSFPMEYLMFSFSDFYPLI